jgi:hypothetical protein
VTSVEIRFSEEQPSTTFLQHKTNEGILDELNLEQVDEKLRRYKPN